MYVGVSILRSVDYLSWVVSRVSLKGLPFCDTQFAGMDSLVQVMFSKLLSGNLDLGEDPRLEAIAEDRTQKSREERIARQIQHAHECDTMLGARSISTTFNALQKSRTEAIPNISTLMPISIAELQVGRGPYRGRVLYCKVITPCSVMRSTMTLVEDCNGDIADLSVYNLEESKGKLKIGRNLAIIEPFYKLYADGSPGIRVDHPDEIKFDPAQPVEEENTRIGLDATTKTTDQASNNVSTASRIPERRPEMYRQVFDKKVAELKDKGNTAFSAKQYIEAEAHYSLAIESSANPNLPSSSDVVQERGDNGI